MLIITLRTDKPEAEIGLYDSQTQVSYQTWQAHRQLAETVHFKLRTILRDADKTFEDLQGIVVFEGPGSFTGLRIGLSVANALAYSLSVSIVAAADPNWLESGIERLLQGQNDTLALPQYGALPNITQQKK